MDVHFAASPYTPLAVSFMGLGTGYLIMGGQTFFKYPPASASTTRSLGIWATAMPAIVQTIAALILIVGITWFGVFSSKPYVYYLAVAFVTYAAHWYAMGWTRYVHADERLEGWMAIPLGLVSVLGVWVLAGVNDIPVAIAFAMLACVYAADSVHGFRPNPTTNRIQGFVQFVTGCWMMYLVWAIVLTYTGTAHVWM